MSVEVSEARLGQRHEMHESIYIDFSRSRDIYKQRKASSLATWVASKVNVTASSVPLVVEAEHNFSVPDATALCSMWKVAC